MRIKIFIVSVLALLITPLFYNPPIAEASTNVNLFQITTDGSQQSTPYVYKDQVVYGSLGEVWGYDLKTQENFEIFQRAGGQFVTDFSENFIIYEDTPEGESAPDVRAYNIKKSNDELIAGGTGAQAGGITNGKFVIYIDGGACGAIHSYNIKKKIDSVISPSGCQPLQVSENTVVWANGAPGGSNIYGYDLKKGELLELVTDADFQESPNIFNDKLVWLHYTTGALGDYNAIKLKDLKTNEVKTIYESTTTTLQSPAVANKYVVWSESSAQHVNGIKGANLKTSEVFEVQPQGSHQNSHTSPSIWKDTAVWMSFRTGNGDIYGATFSK